MKAVVSRRKLSKLCYKVASLADTFEFELNNVRLAHINAELLLEWDYPTSKCEVHILSPISASIYAENDEDNGSGIIDFRELCSLVTSIPKEIFLVEIKLTSQGLYIRQMQ